MKKYKYLIIGGGMTADSAVGGIREVDPKGTIGMISMESDPPYDRPPLTKGLWKGSRVAGIMRKTPSQRVHLHLNGKVTRINPKLKRVVTRQGDEFGYEKLLLATGGDPRRLPFKDSQVIYYRTLADYHRLRALVRKGRRFAVIGAGFIGSEIAAALALNGRQVVMIFPGRLIGERIFPRALAQFVTRFYRAKGVELRPGTKAAGLATRGRQMVLQTENRKEITVDGVVAGLGITPNVELARSAKLKVADGILVDTFLRTNDADIYAAGDVAAFYNPTLGKRMRVEHEDNANTMGRCAGRNMAGKLEPYRHLPFFYSDMFELGYEAVGELDSRLETFSDWKRPNREGVVYYLQNQRVRGVLLWNVWGKVEAARDLIAEPGPFTRKNLKGRLR